MIMASLLMSLPAWAENTEQQLSRAQYQATTGFIYAQEIVEAGRHFYKSYHECPKSLNDLGLTNIKELTNNLLQQASIDHECNVTVTYNTEPNIASELQGKTISVKPSSKELELLEGECSFDGPSEFAPPQDCKPAPIQFLTEKETQTLDTFVMAYRSHNPALLRADALNELNSLIILPKMMVKQFYTKHKRCPTNNAEANISAPEKLSVRFLKGIEISDCDITATFRDDTPVPESFRGQSITYTLHTEPSNNTTEQPDLDWICQSDLENRHLLKDCQPQ